MRHKGIIIKIFLIAGILLCGLYCVFSLLYEWSDIAKWSFAHNEEYFSDLSNYYSELDYSHFLSSEIEKGDIIEVDSIGYVIWFREDAIVLTEVKDDKNTEIADEIIKRMFFYQGLDVYVNKNTKKLDMIAINISTNVPEFAPDWIKKTHVPHYLVWIPEAKEDFCKGSFYTAAPLNENWYLVYRHVI